MRRARVRQYTGGALRGTTSKACFEHLENPSQPLRRAGRGDFCQYIKSLVGGICGWFGWSARRRAAKPVELTAGGIEGTLERLFRFVGVDQWTTLFVDAFVQDLRDVFPSQRRVLMQVSDDLPAQ